MCGLVGGYWPGGNPVASAALSQSLALLHHRGPDDSGRLILDLPQGLLALGQTRLSVIDLSDGGHQPMTSADGDLTLVFNGEIYNYRELRKELEGQGRSFRGESDTEVLLMAWRQWGADCLPRLKGMFAFVVYSRRDNSLTCVRDAFGIKPMFYSMMGGSFRFASELGALAALEPSTHRINERRLYEYLVFGRYDYQEDTFWDGVFHLKPAHMLTIPLDSLPEALKPKRWWWPSIEERAVSFETAADELRERFLENVRLHIRSDVPVGAALSGGVDSSAVVAAMRHLEPDLPITTFSYVSPGSPKDEGPWADLMNAQVAAASHKVSLESADLARDLDDMIRTQGEPFGSTSIYAQYRIYRCAREAGVTVTLDGQGADELLAGYQGYPAARLSSYWDGRSFVEGSRYFRRWSRWPGRSRRAAVIGLGGTLAPAFLMSAGYRLTGSSPLPDWIDAEACRSLGVVPMPPPRNVELPQRGRRLAQRLRYALTGGELSVHLRHGDRNSMRWSIESRVPFLTTDLAEFCLSLPERYLVSDEGETKHVFRHAMRGIVPDAILDRRDKVGFETPEQQWLASLRPQISEWLDGLDDIPIVDPAASRTLVDDMLTGRRPFTWQAWRLINAARWMQLNS